MKNKRKTEKHNKNTVTTIPLTPPKKKDPLLLPSRFVAMYPRPLHVPRGLLDSGGFRLTQIKHKNPSSQRSRADSYSARPNDCSLRLQPSPRNFIHTHIQIHSRRRRDLMWGMIRPSGGFAQKSRSNWNTRRSIANREHTNRQTRTQTIIPFTHFPNSIITQAMSQWHPLASSNR